MREEVFPYAKITSSQDTASPQQQQLQRRREAHDRSPRPGLVEAYMVLRVASLKRCGWLPFRPLDEFEKDVAKDGKSRPWIQEQKAARTLRSDVRYAEFRVLVHPRPPSAPKECGSLRLKPYRFSNSVWVAMRLGQGRLPKVRSRASCSACPQSGIATGQAFRVPPPALLAA